MFSVDFNIFIQQNCAIAKSKFLATVYCFINPIKAIYNDFVAFQSAVNLLLHYNSQVISLNQILNLRFKPGFVAGTTINPSTDIYIEDVASYGNTILFNMAENIGSVPEGGSVFYLEGGTPPTIFSRADSPGGYFYIYNKSEDDTSGCFNVIVPVALTLTTDQFNQMAALINQYKLADKRFKIIQNSITIIDIS